MTLSVYILNKEKIRQADFANPSAISQEMRERKDETLWIYANESVDMFTLQDMFGLHPLTVDAVIHENQPSKIEEYERYIFTIIDGIEYNTNNANNIIHELIEDDLYVFLGHRWIITINFHHRNFEENIRKKIGILFRNPPLEQCPLKHNQKRFTMLLKTVAHLYHH